MITKCERALGDLYRSGAHYFTGGRSDLSILSLGLHLFSNGIIDTDARVLLLNNGYDYLYAAKTRNGLPRAFTNHFVLEFRGLIFDLEYPVPMLIPSSRYFNAMFQRAQNYWTDDRSEKLRLRQIPLARFLSGFELGDDSKEMLYNDPALKQNRDDWAFKDEIQPWVPFRDFISAATGHYLGRDILSKFEAAKEEWRLPALEFEIPDNKNRRLIDEVPSRGTRGGETEAELETLLRERSIELTRLPFLTITFPETEISKWGDCSTFATARILGSETFTHVCEANLILHHTSPTWTPKAGDMVVYSDRKMGYRHYGVLIWNEGAHKLGVESKWGMSPGIVEHAIEDVPTIYGDQVQFFRPDAEGLPIPE